MWRLQAKSFTGPYKGDDLLNGFTRKLMLDIQVPYIYLPDNELEDLFI
jgi:hypothetical protein